GDAMTSEQLLDVLEAVASGTMTVGAALERLRALPFEQLEFATVDHHRAVRCGHPEVIFCPGKRVDQLVEIARRLAADGGRVLATRASRDQIDALRREFPQAVANEMARAVMINAPAEWAVGQPAVAVVSAGTSDGPVAEEASITLRSMEVPVVRITDV